MPGANTLFDPRKHGFRFRNSFTFEMPRDLPIVGTVDLGHFTFGLCGGMCFAARDYFQAGLRVPQQPSVPRPGSALYRSLVNRQIDSLSLPGGVLKVVEWMALSDRAVGSRTASREFPKLRSSLDKGTPGVIALIRQSAFEDPTQNHQVVVCGYETSQSGRTGVLHIYDPNFPGVERQITFDFTNSPVGVSIVELSGASVRGFYLMSYRYRNPAA